MGMDEDLVHGIQLKDLLVETHIGERTSGKGQPAETCLLCGGSRHPNDRVLEYLLGAIGNLLDREAVQCILECIVGVTEQQVLLIQEAELLRVIAVEFRESPVSFLAHRVRGQTGYLPSVLDWVESTDERDEEPEVAGGVNSRPFADRLKLSVPSCIDTACQPVSAPVRRDHERIPEAGGVVCGGGVAPMVVDEIHGGLHTGISQRFC